jgi:hypothetical protein
MIFMRGRSFESLFKLIAAPLVDLAAHTLYDLKNSHKIEARRALAALKGTAVA